MATALWFSFNAGLCEVEVIASICPLAILLYSIKFLESLQNVLVRSSFVCLCYTNYLIKRLKGNPCYLSQGAALFLKWSVGSRTSGTMSVLPQSLNTNLKQVIFVIYLTSCNHLRDLKPPRYSLRFCCPTTLWFTLTSCLISDRPMFRVWQQYIRGHLKSAVIISKQVIFYWGASSVYWSGNQSYGVWNNSNGTPVNGDTNIFLISPKKPYLQSLCKQLISIKGQKKKRI